MTYTDLKKYFTIGHTGTIKRQPITVKAVDGVSFAVREGETFGLVGESGSGKSTVAYTTIGMYRPTEGIIRFRGEDLFPPKKKRPLPYARRFRSSSRIRAPLSIHGRASSRSCSCPSASTVPKATCRTR